MQALWTILLEDNGGTYIAQASAIDATAALNEWQKKTPGDELKFWNIDRADLNYAVARGREG
ncbi:MAG: hypothetical protein ACRYFU_12985 [Janthinobacterium lividum]